MLELDTLEFGNLKYLNLNHQNLPNTCYDNKAVGKHFTEEKVKAGCILEHS